MPHESRDDLLGDFEGEVVLLPLATAPGRGPSLLRGPQGEAPARAGDLVGGWGEGGTGRRGAGARLL